MVMSTSRENTESENLFDSAFRGMRNIDKMLWTTSGNKQAAAWAREELKEEVEYVKSMLDQMVKKVDENYG